MSSPVRYSTAALRDLDRIWNEVLEASRSQDLTEQYLNDLLDKVEAKSLFPQSGTPLYYENDFTGYHYVVFKAYIAFYRVEGEDVFVDRILYGKSDYLRTLIPSQEK